MATDQELRFAIEGQLGLRQQVLVHQGVIERLRADNDQLRSGNEQLVAERDATKRVLEALQARIEELERKLSRNSGNSSKPPSSDTLTERAVMAARRSSPKRGTGKTRKAGKQDGAPGAHLQQVATPDVVVIHAPHACDGCGGGLEGAEVVGTQTRQVFDLPAPRVVVTEHACQQLRCTCGHVSTGAFPAEATAWASWGPTVRAFAVYLMVRQHIPVARCAELLSDALGAPVSTGWLAGLTKEAAGGLDGFIGDLTDRLMASPVLHVDETGENVCGDRWWIHVASTDLLTYLYSHDKRGSLATEDMGILPGFSGVLVHDRWSSYWKYACTHALCGAHLCRDLTAVAEIASQASWAKAMLDLLMKADAATDRAADKGRKSLSPQQLGRLSKAYDRIVAQAIAANPDPLLRGRLKRTKLEAEGFNLAVAFRDHKEEILRFCEDLRVPLTNNQGERDLRMAKLQQKISGGFRTAKGAQAFCKVRSYISTAAKHGVGGFSALTQLFNGRPWAIPDAVPG
ncbi:MAG: IS66 family transposase [Candidatus Dormiibacterota bacterium]